MLRALVLLPCGIFCLLPCVEPSKPSTDETRAFSRSCHWSWDDESLSQSHFGIKTEISWAFLRGTFWPFRPTLVVNDISACTSRWPESLSPYPCQVGPQAASKLSETTSTTSRRPEPSTSQLILTNWLVEGAGISEQSLHVCQLHVSGARAFDLSILSWDVSKLKRMYSVLHLPESQ